MTASAPDLVDLGFKLQEARDRTLRLIAPLSDSDLRRQHSSLLSPIIWDLGHIAHFEEVWLLENMDGAGSGGEGLRGIYDAFRHPRATRDRLPLPDRATCLDYLADVRRAVLRKMEQIGPRIEGIGPRAEGIDPRADTPLLREGYVFNMVLQHEYQHNETILQTLQLMDGEPYGGLGGNRYGVGAGDGVERSEGEARAARSTLRESSVGPIADRRGLEADAPAASGTGPEMDSAEAKRAPDAGGRAVDMVHFPGGNVFIGTDDRSRAYDNERPRTRLRVAPFWIDRHPVDNAAFIDYIAAGGYRTDAHWSEAGLTWRSAARATAPLFWFTRDGAWWTRTLGREAAVDPALPVCHVSWYEADAFARWTGKRLPTEAEWEVAASWDPARERPRPYPWGDEPASTSLANLDAACIGPAPPGSHPRNVSALGCHRMIGDVWEWTSSHFLAYPGFEAFPYPEYSEVFFGDEYRVLRGGSWATRPGAIRNTFRNWDYPQRRQIFSGLRCASDTRS